MRTHPTVRRSGLGIALALAAALAGPGSPLSAAPTLGSNVQIGTDDAVSSVRLGRDVTSGKLFSVLRWNDGSIRVFHSTNGGASWALASGFAVGAAMFDLAVVGGYGYLCYGVDGDLRARRFAVSNGMLDTAYGEKTVFHAPERTVVEVAAVGNGDDTDDLLGCAARLDDGAIGFYYAGAAAGSPFVAANPLIYDGASGLALAWRTGSASSESDILFLTYVSTAGDVTVYRGDFVGGGWDDGQVVASGAAAASRTSVAAFGETALVAFETIAGGRDVDAAVTFNRGESWTSGVVFDASAGTQYFGALACGRSGSGIALVAQHWPTVDPVAIDFRERHGYSVAPWLDAVPLSDHSFVPQSDGFAFTWLGAGWGLAYVDPTHHAWFTFSRSTRYSGFESGDLTEWSAAAGGP